MRFEKKICIYCIGEYGIQMYYKLKEANVQIECFGDRDRNKQGYAFDGLYCVPYEEICKFDRKKTIIIVAVKHPKELIQNFREMGFKDVYDKDCAKDLLCREREPKKEPINSLEEIYQIKNMIVECY